MAVTDEHRYLPEERLRILIVIIKIN